jgi:hypothetical protein
MGSIPARDGAAGRRHDATDFLVVLAGWLAVVGGAAVLPVDDGELRPVALFVHLVCVPLGFGAVVMSSVYTVRWLTGRCRMRDVRSLANVTHPLMAVGLGGLIASGIALEPDLGSTLMRVKLLFLLVVMLNAVRMRRWSGRLETLAPDVAGDDVPWSVIRNIVGGSVLTQSAWIGAIAIGFLNQTSGFE